MLQLQCIFSHVRRARENVQGMHCDNLCKTYLIDTLKYVSTHPNLFLRTSLKCCPKRRMQIYIYEKFTSELVHYL